jgi:hypothetical protein
MEVSTFMGLVGLAPNVVLIVAVAYLIIEVRRISRALFGNGREGLEARMCRIETAYLARYGDGND